MFDIPTERLAEVIAEFVDSNVDTVNAYYRGWFVKDETDEQDEPAKD